MGLRLPIVWMLKRRRKVLYRECRAEIGGIIRELAEREVGCEVVEGGVRVDHIRVCLRTPPKYVVPGVMGRLKGRGALMLCDRHSEWRSRMGKDRAFRVRGRYVSTVGLNEATIKKHVEEQEDGGGFDRRGANAAPLGAAGKSAAGPSRLVAASIRDPYRVAQSSHRLCRWSRLFTWSKSFGSNIFRRMFQAKCSCRRFGRVTNRNKGVC